MNLSKILKRSAVVLMIAIGIVLIPTACTEEVVTNDSTSVSNSLTPASLAAPEITGKAFDGVNYITWKPVKNATGYRIYRDNRHLEDRAYDSDNLEYYDYASLNAAIPSIQNGKSYTYTVVATGVQASRGTNTSTSNNTDFVMTDADILGDGIASVTITAKVPEVFSKVEAAKNVKAAYMEDIKYGKVMGIYFEKPEYIKSYVEFAHDETGSGINIYDYLAYGYEGSLTKTEGMPPVTTKKRYFTQDPSMNDTYTWTPAYGGKYKFRVVTYWDNSFYQSNDVSGDIEIPSQEKAVPQLTAAAVPGGIKLTFTDKEKASYTLYRAEDTDAVAAWSFTKVADDSDFAKTECGGGDVDYAFVDTTGLDYEHYYVYVLTATKGGKALTFDSDAPAVAFAKYNTPLDWNPQFAAINVAGTVSLSWNVKAGITYKVLKCTIDTTNHSDPNATTSHTEEYLTVNASAVAAAVNGVYVMTDTISKRNGDGYYKYTLIGTDAVGATDNVNDEITGYLTTAATFDLAVAGGFDSNKNGIYDKVDITITVNNQYKDVFGDLSAANAVTFYRAVVAADDKNTSAGTGIEFVSEYGAMTSTQIQFIKKAENSTEIVYTYRDTSLSEGDIADNAYAYAAVLNDTAKTSAVVACQLCSKAITLPDIQIKKDSTSANLDSFKVYWNGEFADSTIPAGASTADPDTSKYNAATVSLWYAYTMASTIGDVLASEWNKKADITAANFVDGTYLSDEIVLGEAQSDKQYLYIRVLFNNADNVGVVDRTGPAYKNHWDSAAYTNKKFNGSLTSISSVGTTKDPGKTTIKPSTGTPVDGCYIMTDGTLENITVWVTWLNAGNEILANPIMIDPVRKIPDNSDNTSNGYIFADQISWYFTDEPAANIKSDVAKVLVHITNTHGKVLRDVETGIWW